MKGVFKEGDMVKVKLIEIDKKTGKFRLSRKVLMPRPANVPQNAGRPERKQPQS